MNPLATIAIVAGAFLFVAAFIWRAFDAARARKRLAASLASPDPRVRASAITVATSQGLGRHARELSERIEVETDERVRDTLAAAISRSLWEPADSEAIVDLRLWAEERQRIASRRAAAEDDVQERRPSAARRPTPPRPTRAPEPQPSASEPRELEQGVTVLVTGAGGPAGVNVIRALTAAGHVVVAADADPLAVGLQLAHRAEVIVPADHGSFVQRVVDVARAHRVDALITTVAEEMVVLAGHRAGVEQRVATWLPDERALADCLDKLRFAALMSEAGITTPETTLPEGTLVPGPWVVKPRRGRGSRSVHLVDRPEDLGPAIRSTPDPIVQTRATGAEFTVDTLVGRNGEVVGAVPRWRLETKAGISTKGRTFCDARVLDGVTAVVSALGIDGAVNVQGFVEDDRVTFTEVNPRFSGGLSLSLAAGADLVGEYLRGVLRMPIRTERLTFRPDVTMLRHFQEIYV